MTELALIALAIWLLTKTGKKSDVITPGDVNTTTKSRTGSDDPTSKDYDYATTADEADNNPWTWAKPPSIFTNVPLSPGSRSRWLRLAQLWREYKELQFDIYALVRTQDQTDQERGGGSSDIAAEIMQVKAKANAVQKEIRRLAAIQSRTEDQYKMFLVNKYGAAQTMSWYEERKKEIAAGIWPANDTQIVPVEAQDNKIVIPDADAGSVTVLTPMGARDIERDAKLDALPPGKRYTDAGTVYYEYRKNRSDYPGSI